MGTLSVDKILKTSTGAAEFTLPATDGTAGQVWQTDGSGQLSAGNISGISVAATTLTASGATTLSGATTVTGAFTSPGIDDNADATCITIDALENVGIGVVPKTWQNPNWQTLQINGGSTFFGIDTGSQTLSGVGDNFYRDETGYKYLTTAGAGKYWSTQGLHDFQVAVSGTADAAITWINALQIDVVGNTHLRSGGSIGIDTVSSIADDAVTSFTPKSDRGMIFVGGDSTHMGAVGYVCKNGGTTETYLLLNSAGTIGIGTGVPTGTTGTDVKFNIFAANDGKIYFENRLGGGFAFWYFTMGLPW